MSVAEGQILLECSYPGTAFVRRVRGRKLIPVPMNHQITGAIRTVSRDALRPAITFGESATLYDFEGNLWRKGWLYNEGKKSNELPLSVFKAMLAGKFVDDKNPVCFRQVEEDKELLELVLVNDGIDESQEELNLLLADFLSIEDEVFVKWDVPFLFMTLSPVGDKAVLETHIGREDVYTRNDRRLRIGFNAFRLEAAKKHLGFLEELIHLKAPSEWPVTYGPAKYEVEETREDLERDLRQIINALGDYRGFLGLSEDGIDAWINLRDFPVSDIAGFVQAFVDFDKQVPREDSKWVLQMASVAALLFTRLSNSDVLEEHERSHVEAIDLYQWKDRGGDED